MIRSRVTLATMEAAAIDNERASPFTTACGRAGQVARQEVAVDQRMVGTDRERGKRPAHGQVRGAEDVHGVDLVHAGFADADLGRSRRIGS